MIDPHGDLIQQFLGPDVRIVPAGGITPDERRDLRAEAIRAEQIAAERRKSAFFAALDEVNRKIADEQLQAEAFAAAVGEHTCVCGSGIYFTPDSTLDDYAELNRWLGHHGRCPEVAQLESTGMALIGSVRHLSPRQPLG